MREIMMLRTMLAPIAIVSLLSFISAATMAQQKAPPSGPTAICDPPCELLKLLNDPGRRFYPSGPMIFAPITRLEMGALFSGQRLLSGQWLRTNDGLHTLVVHSNGNVVLYNHNNSPIWQTNTNGFVPRDFVMQTDGNLVLYSADGQAKWETGTSNNPGAFLQIKDDGNLVIYRSKTTTDVLWASAPDNSLNSR
jgi:hypothetical protein